MIFRLEIENCFSIRHRQVIDLRAAGNAPDDPERLVPLWPGSEERVAKVVALFGPNASGKTNVLKALSFLAWFVRHSFRAEPGQPLPIIGFNHAEAWGEPTRLCLEFTGPSNPVTPAAPENSPCPYRYEVEFGGTSSTRDRVASESLSFLPPKASRMVRLLERDRDGKVQGGQFLSLKGYQQAIQTVLRPNASVLSTLAQINHPLATYLAEMCNRLRSNIASWAVDLTPQQVAGIYASDQTRLLGRLNEELEKLGLGVRAMSVRQDAGGPTAWFDHSGLAGPVPWFFESHGTRNFVSTFPLFLWALEDGGVAVIDELDLSIHPLVLPEIVRWFHDPVRNPHHAQLWMTCHNPALMNSLIKEEIYFCEKNSRGETDVFGLREVPGVRRLEDYERKYLGGVYGAVPVVG